MATVAQDFQACKLLPISDMLSRVEKVQLVTDHARGHRSKAEIRRPQVCRRTKSLEPIPGFKMRGGRRRLPSKPSDVPVSRWDSMPLCKLGTEENELSLRLCATKRLTDALRMPSRDFSPALPSRMPVRSGSQEKLTTAELLSQVLDELDLTDSMPMDFDEEDLFLARRRAESIPTI